MRLLCCYLFHLVNYRDVSDAFKRLKFLRQNPDKFNKKYICAAFIVCCYQFVSAITIEFINIVFMTRQKDLIQVMMNYIGFTGVSKLDNIYVRANKHKMETVRVILQSKGEDLKKIKDALIFHKEATRLLPYPSFFGKMLYERQYFLRVVIITYEVFRFIYKCLYFYLFPYLVVPISYYMYDIFKWDRIRKESAKKLIDPDQRRRFIF